MMVEELTKNMQYPIELFDKNNNLIYYKDTKNYYYMREYDENNNLVYYRNSDGFSFIAKFDGNNNQIYYKDSTGIIIDNKEKPIKELTMRELEILLGYEVKIIK